MTELLKQLVEFLTTTLGVKATALVALCLCAIYIWYQHLRNKMFKEQIEFERQKRDDFLRTVEQFKKKPEDATIPPHTTQKEYILVVDDEAFALDILPELEPYLILQLLQSILNKAALLSFYFLINHRQAHY